MNDESIYCHESQNNCFTNEGNVRGNDQNFLLYNNKTAHDFAIAIILYCRKKNKPRLNPLS